MHQGVLGGAVWEAGSATPPHPRGPAGHPAEKGKGTCSRRPTPTWWSRAGRAHRCLQGVLRQGVRPRWQKPSFLPRHVLHWLILPSSLPPASETSQQRRRLHQGNRLWPRRAKPAGGRMNQLTPGLHECRSFRKPSPQRSCTTCLEVQSPRVVAGAEDPGQRSWSAGLPLGPSGQKMTLEICTRGHKRWSP